MTFLTQQKSISVIDVRTPKCSTPITIETELCLHRQQSSENWCRHALRRLQRILIFIVFKMAALWGEGVSAYIIKGTSYDVPMRFLCRARGRIIDVESKIPNKHTQMLANP